MDTQIQTHTDIHEHSYTQIQIHRDTPGHRDTWIHTDTQTYMGIDVETHRHT